MKTQDLIALGLPRSTHRHAFLLIKALAESGAGLATIQTRLEALRNRPEDHLGDIAAGPLAKALIEARATAFTPRTEAASYRRWGSQIEDGAVRQMEVACELPVAARGALMPDAHQGYGLPIGGVLAVRGAVIPYAVGVDIACRMCLSVLDLPLPFDGPKAAKKGERLRAALEGETAFGTGAAFSTPRQHDVLDEDWSANPVTRRLKDKARSQLGSSGGGNHFVEFGELILADDMPELPAGRYLALLSHSGSRGPGATVAAHYSKLAAKRHPDLPKEMRHLAWLQLDSEAGAEYWQAMNLMGRYASANHDRIHHHITERLGAQVLWRVENHHNFAWLEEHDGEQLVVHRKGATPAGEGDLGVIPGTMADPAFIVRGKGDESSLRSASHGAGRRMSRTEAHRRFTWQQTRDRLKEAKVELLSAGLDEAPMAYKAIRQVMAEQADLVEVLGEFHPRLVKMAPAERRKRRFRKKAKDRGRS
ncbi:MAG: RtcB family protein [Acidobacteriota bacterium]